MDSKTQRRVYRPAPTTIDKYSLSAQEIERYVDCMIAISGADYFDTPNAHVALRQVLNERG